MEVNGFHGIVAACLVAVKQLIPETEVTLLRIIRFHAKVSSINPSSLQMAPQNRVPCTPVSSQTFTGHSTSKMGKAHKASQGRPPQGCQCLLCCTKLSTAMLLADVLVTTCCVQHLPGLYVLIALSTSIIFQNVLGVVPFVVSSTLIAWIYLRYFQVKPGLNLR